MSQLTPVSKITAASLAAAGLLLTVVGSHEAARAQGTGDAASTAPAAAQTYALRYKFAVGQIRNYKMSMDMNGTFSTGGRSMPLITHTDMLFSQTVGTVNADGSATISTHLIAAQTAINGQTAPMSAGQLESMQASMPTITMTPAGNVLSVGGPAAAKAFPGVGANPMQFMKMGQAQTLPTTPVKIGDIWRGSVGLLGLTFSTKSVLNGIAPGPAGQIAQIGTTTYGSTGATGMTMPSVGKMYMQANGTGTTDFNSTLGTLQNVDSSVTSKVTVTPNMAAGGAAKPQSVKLQFTMKMHMELLGAAPTAAPAPALPATPGGAAQ